MIKNNFYNETLIFCSVIEKKLTFLLTSLRIRYFHLLSWIGMVGICHYKCVAWLLHYLIYFLNILQVTYLKVYWIPGVGTVNKNDPSPRDQSSPVLNAMHLPRMVLILLVEVQPSLQYKLADTAMIPPFAIFVSSQYAELLKDRLQAIWWEISI